MATTPMVVRGRQRLRRPSPPQAPPPRLDRRGRDLARRPAGHRGARAHAAQPQRRRALDQGLDPSRGQEAAQARGARVGPPPPADHHRVGVPRPPGVGRADDGGPPARRPHPDRRARGRRARRALRQPDVAPVLRGQRVFGQGAERAALDGGGVRRHRQGQERRALRRRGRTSTPAVSRASPSGSSPR